MSLPEAFCVTKRTARKNHTCRFSGLPILKGESYTYVSGVWDGVGCSFKFTTRLYKAYEDFHIGKYHSDDDICPYEEWLGCIFHTKELISLQDWILTEADRRGVIYKTWVYNAHKKCKMNAAGDVDLFSPAINLWKLNPF